MKARFIQLMWILFSLLALMGGLGFIYLMNEYGIKDSPEKEKLWRDKM